MNGYMKHARRVTLRNPASGRWYKLHGFVVRWNERHCKVKRMRTKDAYKLSNHRPV